MAVAAEAEAFLKIVVPFPAVPADDSELLLRAMDRLCAEIGDAEDSSEGVHGGVRLSAQNRNSGVFSPEEEALVVSIRACLANIAAAAIRAVEECEGQEAVSVALDGAELVIRGELARGRAAQLAPLIPSFVFLVTLPVLDQDRALELSHRATELIEEALED